MASRTDDIQLKNGPFIALEGRLKQCPHIVTLGVRPNFSDYSAMEQEMIRQSPKIYYPSVFYADLFNAMGKTTFPSYHTYKFAQDKIKQTAMFELAGISHPRTRVFYGHRQKETIPNFFNLPVIAKEPRGSARGRGVFLIRTPEELAQYCQTKKPAYIQEYLPIDRDMRIVVIGKKVALAYWRIAPGDDFHANAALGGRIDLSPVPEPARQLALHTAAGCGWDNVGIDICEYGDTYYVLEANMKYGLQGFREAGIDYFHLIGQMITNGDL